MMKQPLPFRKFAAALAKPAKRGLSVLLAGLLTAQCFAAAVYGQELEALTGEGAENVDSVDVDAGLLRPVQITPWDEFKAGFGSSQHAVALQTDGMELDGTIAKWESFAQLQLPASDAQVEMSGWANAEDLSAHVYMAYDDDYFYWAAQVIDNNHTPVAGSTMWRGDSIQFAFSPDGTYGPEYGINFMDGQAHVWQFSEGKAVAGADQIAAAATQLGSTILYEVKMPWNTIYTGKPDGVLPFTLLFNDNDGAGRRGWIEWTPGIGKAKSPGSHGKVQLVSADTPWSFWVEGPKELGSGSAGEYNVSAVNWGNEEISLLLSSTMTNMGRELVIPARSAAEIKTEFAPTRADDYALDFTLAEPGGNRKLTEIIDVTAIMTSTELEGMLDAVMNKLPMLEQLLLAAEAQGLSTDYERINYTVIKEFVKYGKEDIVGNRLGRAYYVAVELERLYGEAESRLQSYLDGTVLPQDVPRYVSGRPDISGYSFMGDTAVRSTGAVEERPIFFTGYGHFGKVREDIPIFQDLGNNIIQIEIGPRDVILDKKDFVNQYTVGRSGNVNATAAAVEGVSHSGDVSLQIANASPIQPNVYVNVAQTIPVEPNTTYEFRVWVKGENAKNTWFPGGAAMKQRKSFPSGTFDWREVVYEYTTGAQETSYKLMIVSENAGTIWVDDLSVTKAGSSENIVKNAGFEDLGGYSEDKDYVISTRKLESDIQQALQRAEDHDIAVNLLISPHYFPAWALTKWPELNVLNNGFIKFSLFHPRAKDIIEDYLRALVPAVAGYESLHSITLSNESVYQTNKDAYALPLWHEYLEELYGEDITELNRIYQSSYASFDEVPMPANVTASPWSYDYVVFNQDYFARWHEWMVDVIHELAPDLPLHAKIMGDPQGSLSWGVDIERFSAFSQINGNDNWNYINEGPKGFMEELSFYDMQTSFKQAPVFNSEHHIIADGDKLYTPEQAKHFRSVLWQSAIHGRSASTIWIWERTYDESSSREGSVLHRPDVVAEAGRTNLDLNRLAWEITAFQHAKPEAALLYTVPAGIFSGDYSTVTMRAYEALSYSGHKTGYISEKQIAEGALADYKLLVVPYVTRVDPATLDGIKSFIEQGGRVLLIGTHALRLTPHGEEQAAADRQYIFDHADKITAADWTASQIRAFMEPILDNMNPQHVKLIQPSTGEMPYNVEWRNATYEGKVLLNVVNYGPEAVSAKAVVGERAVTHMTNLITGEIVDETVLTLAPLTPYLFSVDGLEEPEVEPTNPPSSPPPTNIVVSPALPNESEESEEPVSETNEQPVVPFSDTQGHWAEQQINEAVAKGIVSGYPDNSFRPDADVSRQEFAVLLMRAIGEQTDIDESAQSFSDGEQIGSWARQAVAAAVQTGIIRGYEDGSFRPKEKIRRAEMTVMIVRALQLPIIADGATSFADDADIADWAKGYVAAAAKSGIVNGRSGNRFMPNDTSTRGEATVMLVRILQSLNKL
jgi:hypothetical protein